jgi:hypothetical protein
MASLRIEHTTLIAPSSEAAPRMATLSIEHTGLLVPSIVDAHQLSPVARSSAMYSSGRALSPPRAIIIDPTLSVTHAPTAATTTSPLQPPPSTTQSRPLQLSRPLRQEQLLTHMSDQRQSRAMEYAMQQAGTQVSHSQQRHLSPAPQHRSQPTAAQLYRSPPYSQTLQQQHYAAMSQQSYAAPSQQQQHDATYVDESFNVHRLYDSPNQTLQQMHHHSQQQQQRLRDVSPSSFHPSASLQQHPSVPFSSAPSHGPSGLGDLSELERSLSSSLVDLFGVHYDPSADHLVVTSPDVLQDMLHLFRTCRTTFSGCWTYATDEPIYQKVIRWKYGLTKEFLFSFPQMAAANAEETRKGDMRSIVVRHLPLRCAMVMRDASSSHTRCARPSHLCYSTTRVLKSDRTLVASIQRDDEFIRASERFFDEVDRIAKKYATKGETNTNTMSQTNKSNHQGHHAAPQQVNQQLDPFYDR